MCVCVRTEATQRAVVYWFHATVALMVMPCQTRHHSNFQGSGSKTDNMIALLWWYVNQFPALLKLMKILRLEQLNVINFYDFQGCNVFNNRVIPLRSRRQLMGLVIAYVAWGVCGTLAANNSNRGNQFLTLSVLLFSLWCLVMVLSSEDNHNLIIFICVYT